MKKHLWFILIVFGCLGHGLAQSDQNRKIVQKEIKVKIFPNPATSVITILDLVDTEKADIAVTDIYGNLVLKHEWAIKNRALNIPVAHLEKGMYLLTIRSPEQSVHSKFYKQ